jgi:hypothetical protein
MAKKTAAEKNSFGAGLIADMKTVLALRRGEIEIEQVWPRPVGEKSSRKPRPGRVRARLQEQ